MPNKSPENRRDDVPPTRLPLEQEAGEATFTRDAHRVTVRANAASAEDAARAMQLGAEGVGLLRTEFLYRNRTAAPEEEEQIRAYREILAVTGRYPLVARTLDMVREKRPTYLNLGRDPNPELGWRGIRYSLENPGLFKTQLRALLRAGVGHDLRILFPMVSVLEEVRRAKVLLNEARHELEAAGQAAAEPVQVGMMVEAPSAVWLADAFAREVDFFSIGANDLVQYTFAAARGSARLARLHDALHPALLRQVSHVTAAARQAGIHAAVCGEVAGDPDAIPLLLGLGVDELSMPPAAIPQAKAILRTWTLAAARHAAAEALDLESAEAVRQYIRAYQIG